MIKRFEEFLFENKHISELEYISEFEIKGWCEGLDYHKGFLWLSLPTKIQKWSCDGELLEEFKSASEYGESLCWIGDYCYTVSYSDKNIYRASGEDMKFEKVGVIPGAEEHAWGVCSDGMYLLITGHYSDTIYYLDPMTCKIVKELKVLNSESLEDLAYDGRYIWSSSFTEKKGMIFAIDMFGNMVKEYKLPKWIDKFKVDGIAIKDDKMWICGKNSNRIYLFRKPE